jgi:AraC family transcriptional regulator
MIAERVGQPADPPAYHVAYYRNLTGYEKGVYNQAITDSFGKVEKWMAARGLFGPATIGMSITYENPDITSGDKCQYDAAFTIPSHVTEASGHIGVQDIPGGLYATCRIEARRKHPFELAISRLGKPSIIYTDNGFPTADFIWPTSPAWNFTFAVTKNKTNTMSSSIVCL